jgi:exopolysaccharide production protein ExoQ
MDGRNVKYYPLQRPVPKLLRWYYWAAVFYVLASIQALEIIDRVVYGGWEGKPGDNITQGLNLLFILISLSLFCRGFRWIRLIRTGAILSIALTGFLFLTAFWSVDLQATLIRAVLYLFVVIGAIGVVCNIEGNEFMNLLSKTCFLTGVASLVLRVVAPAYALVVIYDAVDFRGIFGHKNVLGQAMVVGALASLHGLRAGNRKRLRQAITLVLVIGVALVSKSATSCLTIFTFCGTYVVIALIARGGAPRFFAICATILLLPVVVFAAAFPDTLLEMIGKDPTLTGRTELWSYVLIDINQRPLLGWGYLAFWSPNNPAAKEISDSLHWSIPQAHNGLLEMLLNVGMIGTAFFIFLWVRNLRLGLLCLRTQEKALAISCLLSCAAIILNGISEMVLIAPFEASTSIFYITGFLCEGTVRAARLRRYPVTLPYRISGMAGISSGSPLHQ